MTKRAILAIQKARVLMLIGALLKYLLISDAL